MILTATPKTEEQTKKIFDLFDWHDTYDFFIEGTKIATPQISSITFQNTFPQQDNTFVPHIPPRVNKCGVIVFPYRSWNKHSGLMTEESQAVCDMLELFYFDGQLDSWTYYVLVQEPYGENLSDTADALKPLIKADVDVVITTGSKIFGYPEAFSEKEKAKIRSLDIGQIAGPSRYGAQIRRSGLKTWNDPDRVPKIFLEHKEELVSMYLCGLAAPLLKNHNFSIFGGPFDKADVLPVLKTLTFGHEDFPELESALTDGTESSLFRTYCAEFFELFGEGMPYANYEPLRKRIEDVVELWKGSFDEIGICLNLGTMPNERTLTDALKTTGEMSGVKSRIDAYYAGVPLEDITATDMPIWASTSILKHVR